MPPPPVVVLFGGTTEATALSSALAPRVGVDVDLIVSFAGRTSSPAAPAGRVRVGGFGGTDGLVSFLRDEGVVAVVDALHPFAAVMPLHIHDASERLGLQVVKLVRQAWMPIEGDRWTSVADMGAAADAVAAGDASRVLLTVGRQELDPFRSVTGPAFVVRSIEATDLGGAWSATELLDRGPFDLDAERALLQRERIDLLVTKNSGGSATAPKLAAARELQIPVVVVERPAIPPVATIETVEEALAWLDGVLGAVAAETGPPDASG